MISVVSGAPPPYKRKARGGDSPRAFCVSLMRGALSEQHREYEREDEQEPDSKQDRNPRGDSRGKLRLRSGCADLFAVGFPVEIREYPDRPFDKGGQEAGEALYEDKIAQSCYADGYSRNDKDHKPRALAVYPVRIEGDRFRPFQELQEDKEGQTREQEEL